VARRARALTIAACIGLDSADARRESPRDGAAPAKAISAPVCNSRSLAITFALFARSIPIAGRTASVRAQNDFVSTP
jgi:hypothetical protein